MAVINTYIHFNASYSMDFQQEAPLKCPLPAALWVHIPGSSRINTGFSGW